MVLMMQSDVHANSKTFYDIWNYSFTRTDSLTRLYHSFQPQPFWYPKMNTHTQTQLRKDLMMPQLKTAAYSSVQLKRFPHTCEINRTELGQAIK